jgi:SAM-dependent methyltransferase
MQKLNSGQMRNYYNRRAGKQSADNYEYFRWGSSARKRRQYAFSKTSLLYHLRDIDFRNCFEFGSGPGTWTKVLVEKYPDSKITSLDISKEMISQLKKNIGSSGVKTIVNNFLDEEIEGEYDFVFSSRAIEYIPDKPRVIRKVFEIMSPGGNGLIVTSHPHSKSVMVKRAFGKKVNLQHIDRISVKDMESLLRMNGFVKISFYPILFSDFKLVPTELLFKTQYKKRWGLLARMFATGYVVKFEKPYG